MGNLKEKEFIRKRYGNNFMDSVLSYPFNTLDSGYFRPAVLRLRDIGALVQTLRLPLNSTILDMGCGDGFVSCSLARVGYEVIGIDISEDAISVAKERARRQNLKMDFFIGDFENYKHLKKVDAIFFYDSLHHSADKFLAINNAYQNLKAGGVIVLFEPNIAHKWLVGIDEWGRIEEGSYKYKWVSMLKKAGFIRIKTYFSYDMLFEKKISKFFELLLRTVYQATPFDFTTRIIARGRKPGGKKTISKEASGIIIVIKRFVKLLSSNKKRINLKK